MEDPRISQQDVAQPLSGTEALPVVQQSINTGKLRTLRSDINALTEYLVKDFKNSLYPAGCIIPYASNTIDASIGNWLLCDGRSVSRSAYPKLYKNIGTTYGSADVDSFNVPNLQGRVIVGYCDTLPTQTFNFGKWNTNTLASVGLIGGEYNHLLNQSNVPVSYFHIPTGTNLVQDVNVSCNVDGSDYFKFSNNTLSIQHRNHQVVTTVSVGQRSYYGNTNTTINSNNAVSFGSQGGTLPFNILRTNNVTLTNKTGRSVMSITQYPSESNNYTTTIFIDDDRPNGRANQSFTLRYSAKVATQNVYTPAGNASAEINVTQPYMALNYIIKY